MSSLKCTVCSQAFKKNDELKFTSCSHMFHSQCFSSCFKASKQCPNCDEILSSSDINSMTFGSTKGSGKSSSKNDAFLDKQTEILNLLREIRIENSKHSQSDSDSDDDGPPRHKRTSHRRRRRDSSDSEDDHHPQGEGSRRRDVGEYREAQIVNRNGTVIKCNEFRPISVNVGLDLGFGSLFGGGLMRK